MIVALGSGCLWLPMIVYFVFRNYGYLLAVFLFVVCMGGWVLVLPFGNACRLVLMCRVSVLGFGMPLCCMLVVLDALFGWVCLLVVLCDLCLG